MLSSRDYVKEEGDIYKQTPGRETKEPIRFGHRRLDSAIPGGISVFAPGCHLVAGPSGSRKTTFVLNMMVNMLFSPHLPSGFHTYWWSIESLMTQEHVHSLLRSIIATRIVIYNKFNPTSSWEKILGRFYAVTESDKKFKPDMFAETCLGVKDRVWNLISDHSFIPLDANNIPDPDKAIWSLKRDVVQSAQFIKSFHKWRDNYTMTGDMFMGYIAAGYCMDAFDFYAEGTSEHSDKKTRAIRSFQASNLELAGDRWLSDVDGIDGNCQFVVDHVTAFDSKDSEYEKQRAFKPKLKAVFDKYPLLFWVIIQDGVGNQRDLRQYGRTFGSMGGDVLRQEVNVNWRKRMYDDEKTPFWDVLERADKSRIGVHPALAFMVAPHSGAYIGEAQKASDVMP